MKKRYLLSFITMLLIAPTVVSAECSYERLSELSKIAENVNLDYTYEISGNDALFTITVNNITSDIYLVEKSGNITVSGVGQKIVNKKFPSGQTLTFTVYSNDKNCKGEGLTTKYITLPHFNVYSQYGACELYPEHKYCKLWFDSSSISRDEFDAAIYEYMAELRGDNDDNTKGESIFEKVVDFITENIILVLLVFIVIIVTVVGVIKVRKQRIL